MPAPDPTAIFHITAIDNLSLIAASGQLLSKNLLTAQQIVSASIAYEHIQQRRASTLVPIAPGGNLHDYVPFHFAPRSPMLNTINQGNVQGCDYRQDDIVHLVSTAQAVAAFPLPFVFTDYHAVMQMATFYGDLQDLGNIDWPLFFEAPLSAGYCRYWHNPSSKVRYATRMETRQAEFLVHSAVPLALIPQIGVRSQAMAQRVQTALVNSPWQPNIQIIPGWYY
ncbi:DUF4433 domain-containing protein [Rhizobium sp. WYCCWR 11128]|nr:DUF4433 domain-containing protein [Rhizobium sp. WYCCWR 11128]